MKYIKRNPGLLLPQLAVERKKGKSTIERYLKQLKGTGNIEFKRPPKQDTQLYIPKYILIIIGIFKLLLTVY